MEKMYIVTYHTGEFESSFEIISNSFDSTYKDEKLIISLSFNSSIITLFPV